MNYRGLYITTTQDSGVERYNEQTGEEEVVGGYYCQVYTDENYENEIDSFTLGFGYEIESSDPDDIESAIKGYVSSLADCMNDSEHNSFEQTM